MTHTQFLAYTGKLMLSYYYLAKLSTPLACAGNSSPSARECKARSGEQSRENYEFHVFFVWTFQSNWMFRMKPTNGCFCFWSEYLIYTKFKAISLTSAWLRLSEFAHSFYPENRKADESVFENKFWMCNLVDVFMAFVLFVNDCSPISAHVYIWN